MDCLCIIVVRMKGCAVASVVQKVKTMQDKKRWIHAGRHLEKKTMDGLFIIAVLDQGPRRCSCGVENRGHYFKEHLLRHRTLLSETCRLSFKYYGA